MLDSGHFTELGANFKATETGWATSMVGSSILGLEVRNGFTFLLAEHHLRWAG